MLTTCDRNFSTLQKLRHNFVPCTPSSISDVASTKVSLLKSEVPIKEELTELFPTLLSGGSAGMPLLELKVDNENGEILKSDKPFRVSEPI